MRAQAAVKSSVESLQTQATSRDRPATTVAQLKLVEGKSGEFGRKARRAYVGINSRVSKIGEFCNSLTEQLNQHLPREVHVPGPDLLGDRAGRPASRSRFAGNNAIRILGR